jgi:uncharacterized protein YutE (UPF0331/DUF86 family)
MDQIIVARKLEALRRCVQRIESRCPPDADTLLGDPDLQDILSLNLTRAVQLCVDIGAHVLASIEAPTPGTMAQTFDQLATMRVLDSSLAQGLRRAVGFRNIAVHNYEAIDWRIVHAIARQHVADFRAFASAIVEWMK